MSGKPPTWKILSAFAALYLIWGTTYLAIAMMVKTIPPTSGPGRAFWRREPSFTPSFA